MCGVLCQGIDCQSGIIVSFCAVLLLLYGLVFLFQLAQAVQFLVAPTPILKTLNLDNQTLKYCVLQLLVDFLKSINSYVVAAEKWLKPNDYKHFHHLITEHVRRNVPNVQTVLKDWETCDTEKEKIVEYTQVDYLKVAFELLELYKKVTPQLVESLNET